MWVPYILSRYDADSIRYFLTMNAPENRDTDFSWREFIYSHNGELLGAYGNFVNRTLKFIEKSFDGQVPQVDVDGSVRKQTIQLFSDVGVAIEAGHFKQALEGVFAYIRAANRYFDEQQPWLQVKDNLEDCHQTLATCVYMIANLGQVLQPFLPFSTEKIRNMLGITELLWHEQVELPKSITEVTPLFERLDVGLIEEEYQKLVNDSQ